MDTEKQRQHTHGNARLTESRTDTVDTLCIVVTLALVVLHHAVQGSTITSLLQLWGAWLWASPLTSREEGTQSGRTVPSAKGTPYSLNISNESGIQRGTCDNRKRM